MPDAARAMRTEIDLDAAARAGIIGEDQAIALRNFQAGQDGAPLASAEKFQFVGGYADLSAAIGLALILGAIAGVAFGRDIVSLALVMIPVSYFLGRYVNLRANPATAFVIMASYLGNSFLFVPALLQLAGLGPQSGTLWQALQYVLPLPLFGWLFWRAYRFPPTIAVSLFVAAVTLLDALSTKIYYAVSFERSIIPPPPSYADVVGLAISTGILVAAIWWDITDIRRETYRSQVAFWLHCVGGFLLIRCLIPLLNEDYFTNAYIFGLGPDMSLFMPVIAMILAMTLLSLLLDRRSLLVSSILPSISLFGWVVLSPFGDLHPTGMVFAGVWLTYFIWSWNGWRRYLLGLLPPKLAAQLPRAELVQHGQRPTRRHLPLMPLKLRKQATGSPRSPG